MRFKYSLLAAALLLSGTSAIAEPAVQSGVDLQALDRQTRPQDDFYQFANGGWLDNTPIPDIYSGYTIYHQVYEDAEVALKAIIEQAAQNKQQAGSEAQKVGDLYNSWMDAEAINKLGVSPLLPAIAQIDAISTQEQLQAMLAKLSRAGVDLPFAFYIQPDLKNSAEYAVYFSQNGLTLPDRDYYLQTDNEKFAKAREGLPGYIKQMLSFVDHTATAVRAQAIIDFETQIAQQQWSRVDNRDDEKTYNPYPVAELSKLGTHLQWQPMLSTLGLDKAEKVIISQPDYFMAMDKMLQSVDLSVWKDYLKYNLIRAHATDLGDDVDEVHFQFMAKTLSGQEKQRPRWKRGISLVNGSLGEAVGRLYVEQHFPAKAKSKMQELVNNVLTVLDEGIDKLEWMSDETKIKAKQKAANFTTKIGYPDKWRDYSKLNIVEGDHFGNAQRVHDYNYQRQVDKLGQPIDRTEWFMTPQTVNAYYDPTQNEIVFPAARLQPPFFQLSADDAINYGAIGGVIGHEISHGFDDSGSKYDGDGNLKNWWSESDRKAFEQRTTMLVEQYNQFSPIEGMTVNGELTLGENIGDLSGVAMAYKAYIRSLNGKPAPVIDGFTGPQRFFIGYAMSRKGKYKEETTISRLASDPHSPLKYRVNGVYPNIDAFYQAFDVKPGDAMYLPPSNG
ncbi:M13 family metallopeptidase [Pseudobowmanella zhangzhouensis]|uniref:M13 family metallopeptidase n=1 Tax=Pseudobowmanella zhangzhouensis TaxID=1537679 RepID=UPI00361C27EB